MRKIRRQSRPDSWYRNCVDFQIHAHKLHRIAVPKDCQAEKFTRRSEFVKGLSLRGYIATTLADLLDAFGKPGSFHQVPACWDLSFQDGTPATIYIYKEWDIPEYFYLWHVGGRTRTAIQRVAEALRTDYYLPQTAYLSGDDLVDRSDEIPF